ncbi:MAG: acyltransferase [Caldithrix sp.]|nr:acyltransferase [Caldithrix sp.]
MPARNHSGWISYWLGRLWMALFGWKVAGQPPNSKKYILIAEPHTSNWDLPFMLFAAYIYGIKLSWMAKHTLFRKPFGFLLRYLGGIPVNRTSARGVVAQMVDRFRQSEQLIVAISPSGTRGRVNYWKSGFYRMACEARIPITCGFLDYANKIAGFGCSFMPTGNPARDMQKIRDFYRDKTGKNTANMSPIRLQQEE